MVNKPRNCTSLAVGQARATLLVPGKPGNCTSLADDGAGQARLGAGLD